MVKVQVVKGQITEFPSDVIVNAANSSLLGGGGVDGAIHRAAGKELVFACRMLGGAKVGEAKITDAFNIRTAKRIVHTVGPVFKGYSVEEAARLLASCYWNSLTLAKDFTSVAFPGISTGIYGYPLVDATRVALATIEKWSVENENSSLKTVTLMAFTDKEYKVMSELAHSFGEPLK